jgi:hypothetical protein
MSANNPSPILTNHAMLVAWGIYARQIGLVKTIEAVRLHQKRREHTPQTKVIEFLVAMLAGLPHLKDISLSAHPLDQDQAVAEAWQQPAWADYSGVSRTLSSLTPAEVERLIEALQVVSQPFIDREVMLAQGQPGYLVYDGDLTGRPVSNSSRTYPGVAYGYMGDAIQLGYQAAMVSMHSPTYGRLWLSVKAHSGDKVACTQLQQMVRAVEEATGVRPHRRTELVRQRLKQLEQTCQQVQVKWQVAQRQVQQVQAKRDEVADQAQSWQQQVEQLAADYERRGRRERPHSALAKARQKLRMYQQRLSRRDKELVQADQRCQRRQEQCQICLQTLHQLLQHLRQLEADNATNPAPVRVKFRLDAGFGTKENVDWLIEMGYELYTKPFSHRVTERLKSELTSQTAWQRVGNNAELTAWADKTVGQYSYPLDVALARYHLGDTVRHSALLYYGPDRVTADLTTWFQTYNGRQTIEAGVKEGKGVFQMHHLKVRAQPALSLQEYCATLAANFVRWAAHWLAQQFQPTLAGFQPTTLQTETRVKHLVQVAAHTSAWVFWQADGCLLKFTEQSLYAGQSLLLGGRYFFQPPLPLFKNSTFY